MHREDISLSITFDCGIGNTPVNNTVVFKCMTREQKARHFEQIMQ